MGGATARRHGPTRVHSTQRRTASLRKTSPAARAARPREDDPIFAAIENHLKLENAWCDLEEAREETQAKAQEKHGRRPSPVVSWRNYVCGSDHIESIREALLRRSEEHTSELQSPM